MSLFETKKIIFNFLDHNQEKEIVKEPVLDTHTHEKSSYIMSFAHTKKVLDKKLNRKKYSQCSNVSSLCDH